ncbi:dihydrofolate reductase family protein [Streptomyces sp. NPDC050355]|uniref:dihydrofolate reductase family protein n=1 Tax=Streptomyces sp. NPDC050355 TaxID=3365609 RepID=UPI003791A975
MGKITHFVHQSLDGYIEGPAGEFDWPVMDDELADYSRTLTDSADIFLYGRVVWDMMAGYWPHAEEHSTHPHDLAFAPLWRKASKIVVSATLTEADHNTRVLRTDVVQELTALKQSGAHLLLFGGSTLAGFLTEHGLIDEYQILVHPVVLGGGKPVFRTPQQRLDLTLTHSQTFDSQVVLLRHAPTTRPA